jgi:hypothetical protein
VAEFLLISFPHRFKYISYPFYQQFILAELIIISIHHKFKYISYSLSHHCNKLNHKNSNPLSETKTWHLNVSRQRKKYVDHFATLDTQTLESLLAENHHHQFAPTSKNPLGPFDKQGFLAHSRRLRNIMTGFPATGKEYIESESGNQVTVWATS